MRKTLATEKLLAESGSFAVNHKSVLLSDFLISWFEGKKGNLGSVEVAYQYVIDIALPLAKDIFINEVDEKYICRLIDHVGVNTPSYQEKLYELFSLMFIDAVSNGIIRSNPMYGIKRPQRAKKEITILTIVQLKQLTQFVFLSSWRLEFLLVLFCGLHKGEMLGLKFQDIDFAAKTLYIQRQLAGTTTDNQKMPHCSKPLRTLKNNRSIPIAVTILGELEKRFQKISIEKSIHGAAYHDNGYVCCQEDGRCRGASSMNTELTKICKRAGLPHMSLECMRDQYAVIMLQYAKASMLDVAKWMGYASVEEAAARYGFLLQDEIAIVDVLGEFISCSG